MEFLLVIFGWSTLIFPHHLKLPGMLSYQGRTGSSSYPGSRNHTYHLQLKAMIEVFPSVRIDTSLGVGLAHPGSGVTSHRQWSSFA